MQPTIIKLDKMTIVGLSTLTTSMTHRFISNLWDRFDDHSNEVTEILEHDAYIGVSFNMLEDKTDFIYYYMAGLIVNDISNIPEGMSFKIINRQKYAKFTHIGPLSKLEQTYKMIYENWLPDSDFVYADGCEIQWYDERFKAEEQDSEFDIYVPICNK